MTNERTHKEYLSELLQDPEEAEAFLSVAFDDFLSTNDTESFLHALHTLALAKGGVSKLAKKTGLNRQNLHRIFSNKNKTVPKLDTIAKVLNGLDLKLAIETI